MSETAQTAQTAQTVEASVQEFTVPTPKSVIQRANRKRFSFGPVWNAAVMAGTAKDEAKLLAQAISMKLGAPSDLKRLKLATLRSKVAAKLAEEVKQDVKAAETTSAAEAQT
jgi:hypothetical protein